jgi:hypothetical protein
MVFGCNEGCNEGRVKKDAMKIVLLVSLIAALNFFAKGKLARGPHRD